MTEEVYQKDTCPLLTTVCNRQGDLHCYVIVIFWKSLYSTVFEFFGSAALTLVPIKQTDLSDLKSSGRKSVSQKKLIGWFSPCGDPWEDMF